MARKAFDVKSLKINDIPRKKQEETPEEKAAINAMCCFIHLSDLISVHGLEEVEKNLSLIKEGRKK